MAQPSKPKQPKTPRAKAKPKAKPAVDKAVIEEAVVVEESSEAVTAASEEAKVELSESVEAVVEDANKETPTAEATPAEPDLPAAAPSEPVVATEQRGGAMPLIFGGVIAACLGAGAIYFAQTNGWLNVNGNTEELSALIAAQSSEIAELKDALTSVGSDLDTLQTGIAPIKDSVTNVSGSLTTVTAQVAALAARIDTTDARVASVETQPIPKAELPAEVTAAFEAKLATMLGTVDGRFEGMQAALDGKLAEIAAAQSAATATEEAALQAANLAEAKAAMSQVSAALDNGSSFAEPLALIAAKGGVDIPASLNAVAEGVPTLDSLKKSFPDVARAALAASNRDAAADGSVSPVTAFFRSQLGARSLEPREGSEPDAVLSRAEAAVGTGDLDAAMTEIAALPQVGQDALTDWVTLAQTRKTALSDAAALAAQIQTN